jgi:Pyruvate/2-oxoacid:ferredoxin oxidoreductase gamma subunit
MGLVDAGSIARRAGLKDTFNTAMLGAYMRFTQLIRMGTLIEAVRGMVPAKVEANILAVQKAYEQVKIYEAKRAGS